MSKILLIEPDRHHMMAMQEVLLHDGHDSLCHVAPDTALSDLARQAPDLVVMELRQRSMDALNVIERITNTFGIPVVVTSTTASATEEAMLLRLGADDYLAKPFSMRVFGARVAAALRSAAPNHRDADDLTVIQRGALRLDRLRHEARWDGTEVALTATEFNVLWIVAQRPGQVLSRANILDLAYGGDVFVTDRSIDSQIKRIRRKIREVAPDFMAIETLYGLGYRFSDSPEAVAA
ncbi:MAG: response regulator transcription factor [Shimia sp.]|uniref:response regulator transcription factor n=1 Tax=Shimia sp. TaxID=1954381 RepID=UPI003B8BB886